MNKSKRVKTAKCGASSKHTEVPPSSRRKLKTMGKFVVEEEMKNEVLSEYVEYNIVRLGRLEEKCE